MSIIDKAEDTATLAVLIAVVLGAIWAYRKLFQDEGGPWLPSGDDLEKGTENTVGLVGNLVAGASKGAGDAAAHTIEEEQKQIVPGEAPALWDLFKKSWDDFWGIPQSAGMVGPGISDEDRAGATVATYDDAALDAITIPDEGVDLYSAQQLPASFDPLAGDYGVF